MPWMNVGGTSCIRHGYSYYDEAILQRIKSRDRHAGIKIIILLSMMLTIIILSLISKVQV